MSLLIYYLLFKFHFENSTIWGGTPFFNCWSLWGCWGLRWCVHSNNKAIIQSAVKRRLFVKGSKIFKEIGAILGWYLLLVSFFYVFNRGQGYLNFIIPLVFVLVARFYETRIIRILTKMVILITLCYLAVAFFYFYEPK